MREKIYNVIGNNSDTRLSDIYNAMMLLAIMVSIIPLMFVSLHPIFVITNYIVLPIFIIDYILRWITYDFNTHKSKIYSFTIYPFTFWAIIDLLSILPFLKIVPNSLKAIRVLRVARCLRIFRTISHTDKFDLLVRILEKEKNTLLSVFGLALGYIFITALIMFSAETSMFDNFFESLYWATTALTTTGYGDIVPLSMLGRSISMISSLFGIAIIALPSGIITAAYMEEVQNRKKD